MKEKAYIIIDIGTGNVRVAVVQPDGQVRGVARADIEYHRDDLYPESIYFQPDQLWGTILQLGQEALVMAGDVDILAFTTTSQREGIVLISAEGKSLIGLPNIDHRGREWEHSIENKNRVYELTGRYPTSLFSAYKLIGIRERRKAIWDQCSFFLSISDWAAFMLSGVARYEPSQASETLLYNVSKGEWSEELCELYSIPVSFLPPLANSATINGKLKKQAAVEWGVSDSVDIVTGGGDTQLAIKSTQPLVDDMIIVSGTTTPIVKLVDTFILDSARRTWTNRDIEPGRFVFEANAGVTGLNYQRLKEIFYPNEGYEVIENGLAVNKHRHCYASLGSLVANEKSPVTRGGFVFPVPVPHELSRSSFVWATLLDIAFSIAENYKILEEIAGHKADYVWACGGGLQSATLRQLIANIIQKKIKVRRGFQQSSAVGGAMICNEAIQRGTGKIKDEVETISPQISEVENFQQLYKEWKDTRSYFRKLSGAE